MQPIKRRNIALCIIFSIITCGIYTMYWLVKINNEGKELADQKEFTSGGLVLLFTIITCGIYGIYWGYKAGEMTDKMKGNPYGSTNILFLILSIFGLDIINYAIMQDAINKKLDEASAYQEPVGPVVEEVIVEETVAPAEEVTVEETITETVDSNGEVTVEETEVKTVTPADENTEE